eukprot:357251-Chlamydomonas_euryale.AAC.2
MVGKGGKEVEGQQEATRRESACAFGRVSPVRACLIYEVSGRLRWVRLHLGGIRQIALGPITSRRYQEDCAGSDHI